MTTETTTTTASFDFDAMTTDDVTTAYRAADVSTKAAMRAAVPTPLRRPSCLRRRV
jgi:hypothetical protein